MQQEEWPWKRHADVPYWNSTLYSKVRAEWAVYAVMQVSAVLCDSDIIIVVVSLCFSSPSTCHINIHFMLNILLFVFQQISFLFGFSSWNFAVTAQQMLKSLSSAHESGTVSWKQFSPLVLGIKKARRFFLVQIWSHLCLLIINAWGLHFNSFRLIISKSWIKDKGVKMLLYGLACLHCMSPAQLNYVFALVKHALKRLH